MYSRLAELEDGRDSPELEKRGPNGTYLIHDILKRFGVLEPPAKDSEEEMFIDDPVKLCEKFEAQAEVEQREADIERRVKDDLLKRAGTPSIRDFPMADAKSAAMSRSSSFGSVQYGGQYPRGNFATHQFDRHQALAHIHPTGAPQPQYLMNVPLHPITPSPSEENFPVRGPFQQSFNEYNKARSASAQQSFNLGPQIPRYAMPRQVDNWMEGVTQFANPQSSSNQGLNTTPTLGMPKPRMSSQTQPRPSMGFNLPFEEPMTSATNQDFQVPDDGRLRGLSTDHDPLLSAATEDAFFMNAGWEEGVF